MTREKQVNNKNGAVLNRDFPRRSRSLIIGAEEKAKRKEGAD